MLRKCLRWIASGCGLVLVFAALAGTVYAGPNIPEIDPGSMASALSLLLGGLLLLTGGRKW